MIAEELKMKKIKKAIIPAAGLGTRFLPATKSLPKEMLPIVDTPTIQYIVEEAVASGIEEILIITNGNKHSMENHFDVNFELETRLRLSKKEKEAEQIRAIANMANIFYVRQKEPKGLGHAVSCAKSFVGEEPFAVLLGDDLIINKNGKPVLRQLIDVYEQTSSSVIGVQEVKQEDVSKYGVVKPIMQNGRTIEISDFVEKPPVEKAPSRFAVLGRYVLTPAIFEILDNQTPGKGGEIQLTDAIRTLMDREHVYAYDFEGFRYDVGDKFGFVRATIDFALEREDLKENTANYIKELAKKI